MYTFVHNALYNLPCTLSIHIIYKCKQIHINLRKHAKGSLTCIMYNFVSPTLYLYQFVLQRSMGIATLLLLFLFQLYKPPELNSKGGGGGCLVFCV